MKRLSIEERYHKALARAVRLLAELDFAHGEPRVRGLNGWVFEQIVRDSIERDLKKAKVTCEISEQAPIGLGRASVDFLLGSVALEVKASGFFDPSAETKYRRYKRSMRKKGWEYFYVTLYESYEPYRKIARRVFGPHRFFVLSEYGEWERFSQELNRSLKRKNA